MPYAIMRFAKYKGGGGIGGIEAHDEREKDEYWKHMVKKYPDLERGESASKTGRAHIPPSLYKEAVHLTRQKKEILSLMAEINLFNRKEKNRELEAKLNRFVPEVEAMQTKFKKYESAYADLQEEKKALEKELVDSKESIYHRLEIGEQLKDFRDLQKLVKRIPPEILDAYKQTKSSRKEQEQE